MEESDPPYISLGNADVLEEEVSGNALEIDSGDSLHDVVADQVNIANDSNTESITNIIGIADHQWKPDGTLHVLCLYDSGDKEWHLFDIVQADDPTSLAKYISCNAIGNSTKAQIIK